MGHSHMKRVHSEESTEKCELCNKSFKSKSYLKTHNNLKHTDVGGFRVKFAQSSSSFHIIIKTTNQCIKQLTRHLYNLCPVTFSAKSSLSKHKQEIHYGVKNVSCSACGMKFSRNEYLKRHIKKMHLDPVDAFTAI